MYSNRGPGNYFSFKGSGGAQEEKGFAEEQFRESANYWNMKSLGRQDWSSEGSSSSPGNGGSCGSPILMGADDDYSNMEYYEDNDHPDRGMVNVSDMTPSSVPRFFQNALAEPEPPLDLERRVLQAKRKDSPSAFQPQTSVVHRQKQPRLNTSVSYCNTREKSATKRDACGHVVFREDDWGYIPGRDYEARDKNSDVTPAKVGRPHLTLYK